ncbi:MAG: type II toxin-antitoxin system RelE/ParE family toxin [Verrucomicrobia bacterium]|nr:type II toxin-antitoxin system RelE/ParE family toxin [Verrucomicrobiota bacterium]
MKTCDTAGWKACATLNTYVSGEASGCPSLRARWRDAIDALAVNPHHLGSTKLTGSEDLHRIRVGDCRALYQIRDDLLIVLVAKIGLRREVYR